VPGEGLLTLHRLDLGEEHLRLRDATRLQLGREAGEHGQGQRRPDPDPARPAAHQPGDAPPPSGAVRVVGPVRGTERPEGGPAQQDQRRREEREGRQEGTDDADRGHRPETGQRVQVAQQQAQDAQDDGQPGCPDRGGRLPQGHAHRVQAVGLLAQLLAEPGHDQQRVVGRGPDHEDGQDPLALTVERDHPGVGQQVDDRRGRAEREQRGQQHQDRQHRAAVDDQQNHQHHAERRDQQDPVDPAERPDQVGELAARPGDVRLPARRVRDRRADPVHQVGQGVLEPGVQGHHGLEGGTVLGRDQRAGPTDDPVHAGHGLEVGRGLPTQGRAHLVPLGLPDEDGGQRLLLGEASLQLRDPRRLRAGREERRVVVLGDLTEPPGERAQRTAHAQPDDHQQDGDQPPAQAATLGQRVVLSAGRLAAVVPGGRPGLPCHGPDRMHRPDAPPGRSAGARAAASYAGGVSDLRYVSSLDDGPVPYLQAWDRQREVHARRVDGEVPDTVLLLEHPPVYTAGKRTDPLERPVDGTPVVDVDRGGKITWHGPGQLVGYPILALGEPVDVVSHVRRVEEALILACADLGVEAGRVEGRSGVWVPGTPGAAGREAQDRKVAAIGIRVSQGVTMHGFALNCDCDLTAFDRIVPCGISDATVTSLTAEARRPVTVADAVPYVQKRLTEVLRPAATA
jgi:lipoyl(octanoyl) transferase